MFYRSKVLTLTEDYVPLFGPLMSGGDSLSDHDPFPGEQHILM
jgi:hypothetical protein